MTRHCDRHPGGTLPTRKHQLARAVSAALLSSAIAAPALSQSLEEVIVTATKRSESVQDVPLAITALSGEFVNKVNLDDIKDLVSFTPGVTGNSQDSFIDAISVRGVRTQDFGVGGDPSTAFFKNDLYEGRNGAAVTSLYDIDRAEILRGPQGFLFGRNSIGGAFSVHTKRAEIGSSDGTINLDAAEDNRYVADGAVTVPMGDHLAMRFAGYYTSTEAWQENLYPGADDLMEQDKKAIRWSTTYERDRLGVYTMAEYEEREQSGSVYRAIDRGDIWEAFSEGVGGVELRGGDEDIDSDVSHGDADDADILTLGLRIDYDLDWATLTSNTGYKDHDYYYSEDYDGTPLDINTYQQDQTGDYFQQELRLTSNSDGPLSWYAGASYYKEEIDVTFNSIGEEDLFCAYYGNYYYPGNDFSNCEQLYNEYFGYYGDSAFYPSANGLLEESGRIKGEYTGWAAYVNLDYYITEDFDVELGVRYTEDKKDFSTWVHEPESWLGPYWFYGFSTTSFLSDSETWDDTTYRVMAKWRPTDQSMFFASYTQGYKSGGFGSFSIVDRDGAAPELGTTGIAPGDGYLPGTFEPEVADSYEIGYKDSLFDGTANIDLTAFYYEYEDLQILYYEGGASLVDNVGEVEAWGVEGSLTASLSDNFTAYFALGYLDSEANDLEIICGSLECEGSPLFWAPDWSAAFMLDAYFPIGGGAITGSLEAFYESEKGGDWTGVRENYIDAFTEVAMRIGYESDDDWYLEAYVENLTDEFSWDGQNINGGVLPSHFFGPKRPRTFGVRLGMNWD